MGDTEVLRQKLLEKATALPEDRLREVLDFIDFLRTREKGDRNSVLEVAGCLSGRPLSAAEIEEELYGENPA